MHVSARCGVVPGYEVEGCVPRFLIGIKLSFAAATSYACHAIRIPNSKGLSCPVNRLRLGRSNSLEEGSAASAITTLCSNQIFLRQNIGNEMK